jgi:hypothetical protein
MGNSQTVLNIGAANTPCESLAGSESWVKQLKPPIYPIKSYPTYKLNQEK